MIKSQRLVTGLYLDHFRKFEFNAPGSQRNPSAQKKSQRLPWFHDYSTDFAALMFIIDIDLSTRHYLEYYKLCLAWSRSISDFNFMFLFVL